ncbi:MBL fold metallo-hydrolase [Rhizobium acaciae]|uniref:MBL fold metallo-hydrolase n=1 Tax=Rhizobium acaciae TaxID=2989736 RepID=UPI003F96BF33
MHNTPSIALTFLGHQGWLAEKEDVCVAFDPILEGYFGHSPGTDFRVFPVRLVDICRLPKFQAVFISHEHLDHFHLPSLAMLPRSTRIVIGPLVPICIEEALLDIGFRPERLQHYQAVDFGAFTVTIFPSGHDTVVWENRVTSYLIRDNEHSNVSIFLAVDALVSEEYSTRVAAGDLPTPTLIIASNNSQIVPYGAFGAQSNLLPLNDDGPTRYQGFSVMHSILFDYLSVFKKVKNVAICGNGFVNLKKPYGPFLFSNNKELALAVNAMSIREKVFGPHPGDRLQLHSDERVSESTVDYIVLDEEFNKLLYAKRAEFMENPIPQTISPVCSEDEEAIGRMLSVVKEELSRISVALLVSPTGRRLLEQNEYLSGPVGALRAVFRLLTKEKTYHLSFDVTSCSFKEVDCQADEAVRKFPMGVEVFLCDLYAVVIGKIQIWDLAGTSMRSWYVGSKYENLIAFLFSAFGEQARPDLASKVYSAAISRLNLHETLR